MKNKKIVSFVASLTMLATASGLTAFASSLLSEKAETPEIVTEEETAEDVAEETEEETEAAEEAAEEEAVNEEAAEVLEEIADEVPDVIAETLEELQPVKPISKGEILAKIDEVFDFDAQDFKDDDAKAAWFAFCEELKASEPKKAEPPVAPVEGEEPIAPPAPVEGEAPIAPPAPIEGEAPIAPPAPIHDDKKPEPPAGPAAPHAAVEAETVTESAEAEAE